MAKLQILKLRNVSRVFSRTGTKYAIFDVREDKTGKVIQAGVSHNSLRDAGYDIDFLNSLEGSTIVTQTFTDRRTGELIDVDTIVDKCLDGEYSICLLNSQNHSIIESDIYRAEKREMRAATLAKLQVEERKEQDLKDQKRAHDRLMAKLRTEDSTEDSTPPPFTSLTDDEEVPETTEGGDDELGF